MGRRTKLKPNSDSHSKSRSAKGSLSPSNLLSKLNPRQGGSFAAEASGNAGNSASTAASAATPTPAAAMVLRNALLEVFTLSSNSPTLEKATLTASFFLNLSGFTPVKREDRAHVPSVVLQIEIHLPAANRSAWLDNSRSDWVSSIEDV